MKLILYVADEFKTLEGGKTLAIGLFTDRVVVLNVPREVPAPSQEMPYGVPLGILACLVDLPKTELTGSMHVKPPSGPTVMHVPNISAKGPVGGSANLACRLDPLVMPQEGIYTAVLAFDGFDSLSETFELRINRTDDKAEDSVVIREVTKAPAQSAE